MLILEDLLTHELQNLLYIKCYILSNINLLSFDFTEAHNHHCRWTALQASILNIMPPFRNKILVRPEPYPAFGSLSASQKSIIATNLRDTIDHLSGKNQQQLFNYFCLNSNAGKPLFLNVQKQGDSILQRIQAMHANSANKHKSSLLSLVAGFYSRNDLIKLGFQFSTTQYHTAMKKIQSENFSSSGNLFGVLKNKFGFWFV